MFIDKKIFKYKKKIYLSPPLMHKEELKYIKNAFDLNWVSTIGDNINAIENKSAFLCDKKFCVGVSNGTAAIHLAIRLAAKKLYPHSKKTNSLLEGKKVFCSDLTFCASCNPILYESGTPIFIDSDYESWNMNPKALEKAFKLFPDVRLVIYSELYGFPGNIMKIKKICNKYHATLIEDAAEALGASYGNKKCGFFGDITAISFNGNKIITGSSGGCVLVNDEQDMNILKKWSTQSRENYPWYEHIELGYNYRMSNIIAGIIRGQLLHLDDHILNKKNIYYKYRKELRDLPLTLNPITSKSKPNYWLTAILIDKNYIADLDSFSSTAKYKVIKRKTSPSEIFNVLNKSNIESRPIWKPMHMQPLYKNNVLIGKRGIIKNGDSISKDLYCRGLCLPSNIHMKNEDIKYISKLIRECFK